MLQDLQTDVFQRSSSLNGNEPLWGPMKRDLRGRVNSSIVGDSWDYTGLPPSPPPPHPPSPHPSS
eukprot:8291981-Pyramimonas_sp.AAC.1